MPVNKAKDELEKIKNKDESCILLNHAGFEWEAILNGKIYNASIFKEKRNTVGINNKEASKNPKILKKMIIAVLKAGLENNIDSVNQLIKNMDYGEELEYYEVVNLLKLRSYELDELKDDKI